MGKIKTPGLEQYRKNACLKGNFQTEQIFKKKSFNVIENGI